MSDYKIVADSSAELPAKYDNDKRFVHVPFHIQVGNEHIVDVDGIDVMSLLGKIAACKDCPKSSCPSPDAFMEAFKGPEKRIYVVTISSHLSGCYNSAVLAKNMYDEEYGDKEIFVIDSLSASGGESLLALRAMELEEQGIAFKAVCDRLTQYRDEITTYVVIDNLDTFIKNGRLGRVTGLAASTLRIKPLLKGDNGELIAVEKAIGLRKAWNAMATRITREVASDASNTKRIIITHCNNLAGAEKVKDMLKACSQFSEFIIMQTHGLSSVYANDGGIIVVY